MDDAGRWAFVRRAAAAERKEAERKDSAVEHVAAHAAGPLRRRVLAAVGARSGVAAAVARTAPRLSPAGMSRRGPRRRFVAGFSGEQFALPEAVGLLRATRRQPPAEQWVSVCGRGPAQSGRRILTPGPRLPALAGNRLLYRDGIPAAVLAGDDVQFLQTFDAATEWTARKALLRGPLHAPSISPNGQGEARREAAAAAVE